MDCKVKVNIKTECNVYNKKSARFELYHDDLLMTHRDFEDRKDEILEVLNSNDIIRDCYWYEGWKDNCVMILANMFYIREHYINKEIYIHNFKYNGLDKPPFQIGEIVYCPELEIDITITSVKRSFDNIYYYESEVNLSNEEAREKYEEANTVLDKIKTQNDKINEEYKNQIKTTKGDIVLILCEKLKQEKKEVEKISLYNLIINKIFNNK